MGPPEDTSPSTRGANRVPVTTHEGQVNTHQKLITTSSIAKLPIFANIGAVAEPATAKRSCYHNFTAANSTQMHVTSEDSLAPPKSTKDSELLQDTSTSVKPSSPILEPSSSDRTVQFQGALNGPHDAHISSFDAQSSLPPPLDPPSPATKHFKYENTTGINQNPVLSTIGCNHGIVTRDAPPATKAAFCLASAMYDNGQTYHVPGVLQKDSEAASSPIRTSPRYIFKQDPNSKPLYVKSEPGNDKLCQPTSPSQIETGVSEARDITPYENDDEVPQNDARGRNKLGHVLASAVVGEKGYRIRDDAILSELDSDNDMDEEMIDDGRDFFAESLKKYKTEYERRSTDGKISHADEVKLRAMEKNYHRNLRKRKADDLVAPEELKSVKNTKQYKEYQADSIHKKNLYRSRRTELEYRKRPKKSPNTQVQKKLRHRPNFKVEDWRAGSNRLLDNEDELSDDENDDENDDGISLRVSDMFEASRNNEDAPDEPKFASEDTRRAMTEMMASVITGSRDRKALMDEREMMKSDREKLREARSKFQRSNRPKPNGNNAWNVPRMISALKSHQVIGAGWMRERERADQEPYGGILADDMGLGKTVEVLATIMDGYPTPEAKKEGHKATLVIVPSTMTKQWFNEIKKHCHRKWAGKVMIFRTIKSSSNNNELQELKDYNIIITTYEEVQKSYPKDMSPDKWESKDCEKLWLEHYDDQKGLLHRIHFWRMVLDEAHRVKNHRSSLFKAVKALRATNRWLVTATPITNKIEEIYPYWKIIFKDFVGSYKTFKKNYCGSSSRESTERLTTSLMPYIYRRTKDDKLFGKPIQKLPKCEETVLECEPTKFELDLHNALVEYYAADDGGLVINMINSLRSMSSHVLLLQDEFERLSSNELDKLKARYAEVTEENYCSRLEDLQEEHMFVNAPGIGKLYGKSSSTAFDRHLQVLQPPEPVSQQPETECDACSCSATLVTQIHPCEHGFCDACAEDMNIQLGEMCLVCGIRITHCEVPDDADTDSPGIWAGRSKRIKRPANQDWLRFKGIPLISTKTLVMKLKILEWIEMYPDDKIVIFTEFREMIYILKRICNVEGWKYRELHGGLESDKRQVNINEFKNDSNIRILLATKKVGGVGLNLTEANRVIMMEGWWNTAMDQQAFSRVHREGQMKECECVRIFLKGTIDNHMEKIRKFKNKRISQIDLKGECFNSTYEKLMALFGPGDGKGPEDFVYEDDTHIPDDILDAEKEDISNLGGGLDVNGSESDGSEYTD